MVQTEASCIRCKNVKDGPYCRPACPPTKYPDDSDICQDCHVNCIDGCSGPLNSVGAGACNACHIAVYDGGREVKMCLPAESECDAGFFEHVHLPSEYGAMTGKKVGALRPFQAASQYYVRRCRCGLLLQME